MRLFDMCIAFICNILNKFAFCKKSTRDGVNEPINGGLPPSGGHPDSENQDNDLTVCEDADGGGACQGESKNGLAQDIKGEPEPELETATAEEQPKERQPKIDGGAVKKGTAKPLPGKRGRGDTPKDGVSKSKPGLPSIICQENGGGWSVALEKSGIMTARQGTTDLQMTNHVYPLPGIEDITVTKEDGSEETISLGKTKPLVFQTSKNWKGKKRLVKHVSPRFCYVVCAPACCGERKNHQPRIVPENTIYEGYQMHFFASGEELASDGFEHCSDFIAPREFYHLEGRIIADHSDKGDLFAEIPMLTDGGQSDYGGISVHVGEEGRSGWAEEIDPSAKQIADVLKSRAGWFFLRVYRSGELIVSADFRYLPGLDGIIVAGNENWESVPIIPASDGHVPTSIEFIGNGICAASESIDGFADNIPASAGFDATEWTVKNSANQEVKVSIALPRVWWRTHKNQKSEEWMSTPIELDRVFLKNATRADGGVEIRVPDFTRKIQVGFFADDNDCLGITKENRASGKFLYTDFSDDEKIENAIEKDLFLWGCLDGGERFRIARIPADMPPPAPKPEPPQEPAVQPPAPPVPWVMGVHRKWRRGKGFSVKELRHSGAGKVNVAIDKRRKSCYSCNIDALRKLSDTSN